MIRKCLFPNLLVFALTFPAFAGETAPWQSLAPGLDLGHFQGREPTVKVGDAIITILRIDPQQWDLRLLCSSETETPNTRTPQEWCEQYGLVAAINAGMYADDHRTHVGYLRNGTHVNNSEVNHYQSVAAFRPQSPDLPPFRIFDLDREGTSINLINQRYDSVVQNLRLIRRPGENRWFQRDRQWSEVALGEDAQGRVLFIFCGTPYTMPDFNDMLLSLPIDLVCAQHLDGGPVAQLFIRTEKEVLELTGDYESDCCEDGRRWGMIPIPFVIGVAPRQE